MRYAIRDFGVSFDNEESAIQFCSQVIEKRLQESIERFYRKNGYELFVVSHLKKRALKKLDINKSSQTVYKKYLVKSIYREYFTTIQCTYQIINDNFYLGVDN